MTTPLVEPETKNTDTTNNEDEQEKRKRRRLLILLLWLLLLFCCLGYLVLRYFLKPAPLPDMLPAPVSKNLNYPPAYKFSINELDRPVGVAVSPDGTRVYAVESAGERLIKMFGQDGKFIKSFAPPGTTRTNRKLNYIAVDASGRVFVNDAYNNVIAIFDADGNFIDGIVDRDATLSKMVAVELGSAAPSGTLFYYDNIKKTVDYKLPGQEAKSIPGPTQATWSPIGLRFDLHGNLLVTNAVSGTHQVLVITAADLNGPLVAYAPTLAQFGVEGKENGQLSFPNSVVTDSRGNFYVSDGNNGRISAWTPDLQYKTFFGFGSTENSLNLPRGIWMDSKDRLHVADAVGQYIRVYDVSGEEAVFLYSFGDFGIAEGEFNFPNDICIDGTGRLYIADRENNRVQVWSY